MHRSIQRDFVFRFWVSPQCGKGKEPVTPAREKWLRNGSLVTYVERRGNYLLRVSEATKAGITYRQQCVGGPFPVQVPATILLTRRGFCQRLLDMLRCLSMQ
jgi:hypothetical protein